MIAATVLAAGASARMGSPKALLEYRGRTFIESILDSIKTTGLERCIVVVEPDLLNQLSPGNLRDVSVIPNGEPFAGPVGSVRSAIRYLRGTPIEGLMIWPVDLPHVSTGTIQLILRRAAAHAITVPRFGDKRGHPIIIKKEIFQEILQLTEVQTLKDVVRADRRRVGEVLVDDPAVVDTINTPEDYNRLLRSAGSLGSDG